MEAVGRLAGGVAHDFNNLLTVITSYSALLLEDLGSDDPKRDDVDQIRKAAEGAAALTRQLLAFSRQQVLQPKALDLKATVAGTEKLLKRLIGEDIQLDRKSTRLNSSHLVISYAVFCLKKKKPILQMSFTPAQLHHPACFLELDYFIYYHALSYIPRLSPASSLVADAVRQSHPPLLIL